MSVLSRVWNVIRARGPELLREAGKETAQSAPGLFTPEVRQALRDKISGDGDAPDSNNADVDFDKMFPPPPMPDFSKADPYEGTSYVFESPAPPDFSFVFKAEDRTTPPPARAQPVDKRSIYCFGGGVGIGVTIGYIIWGRGGN